MEPVRSGCFCAFVLFLAVRLRAADCVTVIVGDQFEVPVSCEPGESGRLLRDLGDHGTLEVATCQRGEWTVTLEKHRDRIKIISSNIVFAHTLYTDGGMYEVTCSESGTKPVQLEVVFAVERSVTEGDHVTLPCYGRTIGGTGLPGLWEKDGKHLCGKNSDYEECSETPADRLTVSNDWTTNGDLSLTIAGVQPQDSGDYFCYTQDQHGKQSGTPAAVRLTVTKKMTHQMINNSTAAPRNQTNSCAELTQPWQISTGVLTAILLLVALFYLWLCGKNRCDSGKLYELEHRSCHASNSGEATTGV
ncbi:uncharacterized protein LOC114157342 [Xiphophorus couchianus]|uniref:uncharacterized protein LOC114157342 n=1 Tax=Xiphophorus couchianus TaxID=32473 RepID=UPI0010166B7F|nr:uncharacterized protein LOC114157342 [Xiphophorus couchianus]